MQSFRTIFSLILKLASAAILLLGWTVFTQAGLIFIVPLETAYADVTLMPRNPPARAKECQNCHRKKDYIYIPDAKKPKLQHGDIQIQHGKKDMSCNFCHNKNNHNFLFSAQKANDFSNSALVCQTCHSDVYKKWIAGTHGKRIGGWKDQIQLQCIECHNPHRVSFPKMRAIAPPPRPHFIIPKEENEE